METTKTKNETYEIVSGTRVAPGAVLATFAGTYRCGGPATACLRAWARLKAAGTVAFFRKAVRS